MGPIVAVIDYDAGNLRSISRALTVAGARPVLMRRPDDTNVCDVLLLPGVGAFGAAMTRLTAAAMTDWIRTRVRAGTPLIGVCLGMQLLYAGSEEGDGIPGLGLLGGYVRRLPRELKVPHMGWNSLDVKRAGGIVGESEQGAFVYFVHSYVADPADDEEVVATSAYGIEFPAIVRRGQIAGLQFHPEKSGATGHRLLRNALNTVLDGRSV